MLQTEKKKKSFSLIPTYCHTVIIALVHFAASAPEHPRIGTRAL